MSNPYQPPQTANQTNDTIDKVQSDLKKLLKAKKSTFLIFPIVCFGILMQYTGVYSPGFLPNWFGFVVIAALIVQLPILNAKIKKKELELANITT